MTRYEALVQTEIEATVDRAGFESVDLEQLHVDVTDSFRRTLGECRPIPPSNRESGSAGEDEYEIRIARRLFEDGRDDQWRDTVRHEVAHAYVLETNGRGRRREIQPHGTEWKDAARRAGADPVARYEDDGLVDAEYVLACPNGCFERGYVRRSKRVKHPWQYTCDDCGTSPLSYDVGERASDLDPGTCYVRSIPWQTRDERSGRDDRGDRTSTARYVLACPNGCTAWPYQQRTKRIKNPWLYSCPACEASLLSCDGDDRPTDLDPGICYVASIPWQEPQLVHACPNGCFRAGYGQHCEETRHPDRYGCEDCGARTIAYPADDRPTTLEPGTSYLG